LAVLLPLLLLPLLLTGALSELLLLMLKGFALKKLAKDGSNLLLLAVAAATESKDCCKLRLHMAAKSSDEAEELGGGCKRFGGLNHGNMLASSEK
jgi:hypothetical protein